MPRSLATPFLRHPLYRLYYLVIFIAGCAVLSLSNLSYAGFSTSGTQILDDNGEPFIFRGVNHPHTWYNSRTPQALSDIASVGANAVRVVLSNGTHGGNWGRDSAAQVGDIIQQCKQNKLVCMLEIHDATGHPESADSSHMSTAIDYWLDIASVLQGEENFILINLANEPFGNTASPADWVNAHVEGIERLRSAGLNHTLVVDAANWGQDWQNIMLDNAQAIIDSDPNNNLVFSVHMYEVYQNRERIENYVSSFLNRYNVPLIVGEFGADHQGNFVDADSIMAVAEAYSIGYLGWSWSGNGSCCVALDMENNFNVDNFTVWGERIINGSNGIRDTAVIASVYQGSITPTPVVSPTPPPTVIPSVTPSITPSITPTVTPSTTPSVTPTTSPPPIVTPTPDTGNGNGLSCEITFINVWNTGYQLDVTVTNNGSSATSSWEIEVNFPEGANYTGGWNAEITQSGGDIVASNLSWNANLAPGASTSFGLMGGHDGSFVPPSCRIGD